MAEQKVTLNPGDTLIVESPTDPGEYDQAILIDRGDTGIEIHTEKGRRVHLCHTDEVSYTISSLLALVEVR